MTTETCDDPIDLSDADLVAIVRGAADNEGTAHDLATINIYASCRLSDGHGAAHASWVAQATNHDTERNVVAWLRWTDDGTRTVDWLADCATKRCVLFRGHQGGCDFATEDAS
jgi:hypothetical protein